MKKHKDKSIEYKYKNFKICCQRELCLSGYPMTYYQIYDMEGTELVSTFTEDITPFKKFAEDLKNVVNNIIDRPNDYYED